MVHEELMKESTKGEELKLLDLNSISEPFKDEESGSAVK